MTEELESLAVGEGEPRRDRARSPPRRACDTLWDDGLAKVASGLTSVEELTRVVLQLTRGSADAAAEVLQREERFLDEAERLGGGREAVGPAPDRSAPVGVETSASTIVIAFGVVAAEQGDRPAVRTASRTRAAVHRRASATA